MYWTSDAEVLVIGQSGHYLHDLNQVLVFPTASSAREWLWLLPSDDKNPSEWMTERFIEFESRVIEYYYRKSEDEREQAIAAGHDYLLEFYIYDTSGRRLRAGVAKEKEETAKAVKQKTGKQEEEPSAEAAESAVASS